MYKRQVNGLSSDVFAPDAKITRQQMAVMIVNAMKDVYKRQGCN